MPDECWWHLLFKEFCISEFITRTCIMALIMIVIKLEQMVQIHPKFLLLVSEETSLARQYLDLKLILILVLPI